MVDITDEASAENVKKWLSDIRKANASLPILIVGNKLDLQAERVVSLQRMQDFCTGHGLHYLELSAKEGTNVDKLLPALASLL